MGKVFQKVWVENATDISNFQTGLADHIRGFEIEFRVDTGATGLLLPTAWIEKLGLISLSETRLMTGNGEIRSKIFSPVQITILDRSTITSVTEIKGDKIPPLLGYIPLQAMELIVDLKNHCLVPTPETKNGYFMEMYLSE